MKSNLKSEAHQESHRRSEANKGNRIKSEVNQFEPYPIIGKTRRTVPDREASRETVSD